MPFGGCLAQNNSKHSFIIAIQDIVQGLSNHVSIYFFDTDISVTSIPIFGVFFSPKHSGRTYS